MALKLAPKSGLSWIPAIVLVISWLAITVNQFGSYVTLTPVQAQWIALIAFILTALATLLTNVKDVIPPV